MNRQLVSVENDLQAAITHYQNASSMIQNQSNHIANTVENVIHESTQSNAKKISKEVELATRKIIEDVENTGVKLNNILDEMKRFQQNNHHFFQMNQDAQKCVTNIQHLANEISRLTDKAAGRTQVYDPSRPTDMV